MNDDEIAAEIAGRLKPGQVVNLGIGKPMKISNFVKPDSGILLHTENGMLGVGGINLSPEADSDIINAAKQTVSEVPGASYFDSVESFSMIRGGHVDVCIMGAYEVTTSGLISNWSLPGSEVTPGVGGSMDLLAGAGAVWVFMDMHDNSGRPKIVQKPSLPITGLRKTEMVFTDKGVFKLQSGSLVPE